MTKTKLEFAYDIFKNPHVDFSTGFDNRVMGHTYVDTCTYPIPAYKIGDLSAGWKLADEMIADGKIYYVHIFPHDNCSGLSLQYGGCQCCNTCGRAKLEKPWWTVRVFKDGSAWCCTGLEFVNLQESDNFAFGATREDALSAYKLLMDKQGSL